MVTSNPRIRAVKPRGLGKGGMETPGCQILSQGSDPSWLTAALRGGGSGWGQHLGHSDTQMHTAQPTPSSDGCVSSSCAGETPCVCTSAVMSAPVI